MEGVRTQPCWPSAAAVISAVIAAMIASMPASVSAQPAATVGPLMQQHGQHPLNAVIGVPSAASRHHAGAKWQVALEHGNTFMGGVAGEEALVLDGESTELTLRHRRSLGSCWQAEAMVPLQAHTGGAFDGSIDDWHNTFGLPGAQRSLFPEDELRYQWADGDGEIRSIEDPVSGVGDLQFSVQRSIGCRDQLRGEQGRAIARIGIVLPTGDEDSLLGSGTVGVWADLQSPIVLLGGNLRLAAAIGVAAPGRSDLFDRQNELIVYGSIGIDAQLATRWQAVAQIDAHTPFHDSDLPELGDVGAGLGVGFRFQASATQLLEFGIVEDIIVDTKPDIVARLAWVYRPKLRRNTPL